MPNVLCFNSHLKFEAGLQGARRLASRLAAGWEVQGRWEAFRECVFVRLMKKFEEQHRPHGWLVKDFKFLPQKGRRTLFAWTLCDELLTCFGHWLVSLVRW